MSIVAKRLTDRASLNRFLLKDPIGTAYQLGDLGEAYRDLCHWYGCHDELGLRSVLLVYTGLSLPVIITYGEAEDMRAIVTGFRGEMPGRALVHSQPDHVDALEQSFVCKSMRPMVRMGMLARDLTPVSSGGWAGAVEPLGMRHTGEIIDLFQYYPDHFFEPAQLATGHYYGIRMDDRLVSVAGIHVFSASSQIACLGNIVTHPDYRGKGFSTACTSHLCSKLASADVRVFALNVARDNSSAFRVYEKLGFQEHMTYFEGLLEQPFIPNE
jgi:RimJ/RimL family protein N-acetyltransferase